MSMYGNKDGAPFGSFTAEIASGTKNKITFSGSIASYGVQAGDTIIFDTAAGSGGADAQHLKVKYVESDTVVVLTKEGTAAAARHNRRRLRVANSAPCRQVARACPRAPPRRSTRARASCF